MHYIIVIINLSAFILGTHVSYSDGAYDPASKLAAAHLGRRCEECGQSYCECPSSGGRGKGYVSRNISYEGDEYASGSSSYECAPAKGSGRVVSYSSGHVGSSGSYGGGYEGGGYVSSGEECGNGGGGYVSSGGGYTSSGGGYTSSGGGYTSSGGGYASGGGGGKGCSTGSGTSAKKKPVKKASRGCTQC